MSTPSICEIIARLGNSCVPGGLPWARCRCTSQANRGIPEGYPCTQPRGHAGDHRNRGASWRGWADPLPPMLTEWAAEWERGQKCPDCGKENIERIWSPFSGRTSRGGRCTSSSAGFT